MNKLYSSFKIRMMILCAAAFFLIITVVHISMYIIIEGIMSEQIALSAQSAAIAIAGRIMEEADEYRSFLETRDEHSPYYQRMRDYFTRIKSSGGAIRFIYTERFIDGEKAEALLNSEPVGSDDYSPPGEITVMNDAERAVYATGLPARLTPKTTSRYGTLLGGCAPLFDGSGAVRGLVGVNVDGSEIFDRINKLQGAMLLIYAAVLAVCLALLNKYARLILDPVFRDKATGAYSKRCYDTLIQAQIQAAVEKRADLALLMLDLDHFKNVNDTYGHHFGDRVLQTAAKGIMSCLRANDYFIRYGGEEFVVIIAGVTMEVVLAIAERIRLAIGNTGIYNEKTGLAVKITISIGVSHLGDRPCTDKQLLEEADKALYDAKRTRNAVSLFAKGEQ